MDANRRALSARSFFFKSLMRGAWCGLPLCLGASVVLTKKPMRGFVSDGGARRHDATIPLTGLHELFDEQCRDFFDFHAVESQYRLRR